MTLRYSQGATNYLAQHGSFKDAFNNGKLEIYTGSQPASADAAPTGTLLCTITASSGTRTAEVLSVGTVTLSSGAAGSIDTLTVDGISIIDAAVAYNTSLTQTAADLAAAINQNVSSPDYTASSSGAVVTIKAKRGSGAAPNGFVVTGTATTLSLSYGNMASGQITKILSSLGGFSNVGFTANWRKGSRSRIADESAKSNEHTGNHGRYKISQRVFLK